MKKFIALMLIALMALTTVFASGSSEAASTESGTANLRFLWWGGENRHKPTLAALGKYHELNPNVTITGEYAGWDGYYQKIVTQIAGGTAPDIIQIDQPWVADLCSKGDVFAEVDPSVVDLSTFDMTFVSSLCSYDGKIVGLPTGTNVNTMLVDRNMLQQAGIDPNTMWTWENIVENGKKMNDYNPEWHLVCAGPDHIRFWFELYMAQLCGGVVDGDKNVMFTEEQGTQAFEYFKKWFDNGVVAPFSETSIFYQKINESPDWFAGKNCLMWTWVSSMEKDRVDRDMDTTQLPVMDGAKQTGVLVRPSQILVINNTSKHKDEAMKFMNWFFNDKEAALILNQARGIPSSSVARDALEEAGLLSEFFTKATNEGLAQAGLPQSVYQMNSEVIQTMQDVIDEFGFGKLSPAEASKKMISSLNATLKNL